MQDIPIRKHFLPFLGRTFATCGSGIDATGHKIPGAEVSMFADRMFIKNTIAALMASASADKFKQDPKDEHCHKYFLESVDVYAPCSILDKLIIVDAPGMCSAQLAFACTADI